MNVLFIALPPLRERRTDIRLLVDHIIKKYANERKSDTPVIGVDQEVERLLYDYDWPGNVRELENVIEQSMILCPGETIKVSDLPKYFKDNIYDNQFLDRIPENAQLNETLAEIEKKMIERALRLKNNVHSDAAELLGIGKSGFSKKLRKYGMH